LTPSLYGSKKCCKAGHRQFSEHFYCSARPLSLYQTVLCKVCLGRCRLVTSTAAWPKHTTGDKQRCLVLCVYLVATTFVPYYDHTLSNV
jgi:hypothetical protein